MDPKQILELLQDLRALAELEKINSTFLPVFDEKVIDHGPAHGVRLHGNFNLGGTRSGRLSSNNPNLTQLPSTGTTYAKDIKQCFGAPKGWLMCGADFKALEAVVGSLQTKDPNKLAVYEYGYDSHCWNSYAYFKDQMPDITEALDKAELPGKFYKVTHENGDTDYLHESDPRLSQLRNR